MRLDRTDFRYILETALSGLVIMGMLIYGAGKWVQFQGAAEVEKTVAEMTGMELMWAFYGYSWPFALTVGGLEILGGLLMLWRRTRLIGCLLVTTILVNIILQDIFYEVLAGALGAALIYQAATLGVLWLNRDRIILALRALLLRVNPWPPSRKTWLKWALAFGLFVLLRIGEFYLTAAG